MQNTTTGKYWRQKAIVCVVLLIGLALLTITVAAASNKVTGWDSNTDYVTYFESVTYDGNVSLSGNEFTLVANDGDGCTRTASSKLEIITKAPCKITYTTSGTGTLTKSFDSGSEVGAGQTITFVVAEASNSGSSMNITLTVEAGTEVFPEGYATYQIVGKGNYNYLDLALGDAVSGDTIIVNAPGGIAYHSNWAELEDGDEVEFFIPSGVKLLVPYSTDNASAGGNFDEAPDGIDSGYYNTQAAYCTLTIPSSTTINCEGEISVDSQIFANTAYSGAPAGTYGCIILENSTSKINLKSGSKLYCYGYIIGKLNSSNTYIGGTVTAESGAAVYESFQALGWRGGNSMLDWAKAAGVTTNDYDSATVKSFAFSDYAVQNIEANFLINCGATVNAVASIEALSLSGAQHRTAAYITNSETGGLLRMTGNSTILRVYDPYNDRMTYTISGTVNVGNISLSLSSLGLGLGGLSFDTANHIFGINRNMEFIVASGSTLTLLYDYKMMPNSKLTIQLGGKVIVQGDLYIYDTADFAGKSFAYHQDHSEINAIAVSYIATTGAKSDFYSNKWSGCWNNTDPITTSTPCAQITVDGTLEVRSTGGIYTTSNGGTSSDKIMKGTGTFINASTTATAVVNDRLDEITHYYASATSHSVTDVNIAVTPVVGLIAGLSTSTSDYKCFEANGAIYHGTESGYWYEYVVESEEADIITDKSMACSSSTIPMTVTADDGTKSTGTSTNAIGIVGNGFTINFDSSTNKPVADNTSTTDVYEPLTAASGNYSFSASTKYAVKSSGSNAVLTPSPADPVWNYTLSEVDANTTLTLYDQITLDATSLDIEGQILLNLKFCIPPDMLIEGNSAALTEEDCGIETTELKTWNVPLIDLKALTPGGTGQIALDESGRYVLSQGIAAGEMTGKVTVQFTDANGGVIRVNDKREAELKDSVVRTVKDFTTYAFAEGSSELQAMCHAMLTYGQHAQMFYDIAMLTANNTDKYELLDGTGYTPINLTDSDPDLSDFNATVTDGNIGISATSQLVNLDSEIYLRTYLTLSEGRSIEEYTFTLEFPSNNTTYEAKLSYGRDFNDQYYVDIQNIPPAYWKEDYTITITETASSNTYVLKCSVFSWIKSCLKNSTDSNEKLMAEAMYYYCTYAADYFASKTNAATA